MRHLYAFIFPAIIICCSCTNNLKSVKEKFGTGQNSVRERLHLVKVDPGFKLTEDQSIEGRRFIFVNKEEAGITLPEYLRKTILLDSARQKIYLEEDYYKNPLEEKYLIVNCDYAKNTIAISLQYGGSSEELSSQQADSILKNWKISINPF